MDSIKINRIQEVLEEKGKRSKDLVTYLNVQKETVSRWINNKQQPSVLTFYEIAKYLRIDIRDLFHPTEWND